MVDGKLYAASPNNVFAIDARDGAVLWHNYWKSRGGTTTGTRGPGMLGNLIYFTQHDDWVLAIDARNGKEVWRHEVAPFDQQYFSSIAPMPIKGHLLVGTGNDLDAPAFLKSLDPRTGAVRWILYSTPQKEGDPGLETWASLDAAKHGNGATWIPGAYDPETNLYMYGTGNPTPSYTQGRGEGDNLFTSSLLAVDVDTGKMKWYFQTSPHDTHDWDSTQTPAIVDAPFNGRTRKLVMTATRNGYFFVLDRTTGAHLVTSKLGLTNVWAQGLDAKGQPKRNPHKDAQVAGTLVNGSVLNYPPPTFSPDTGLFYINENNGLSVSYLMEPDPRGSMGLGGISGGGGVSLGTNIVARGLQDREDRLAQEDHRRQPRTALDGRRRAVREQRAERRGVGRRDRQGPLVLADRRPAESARDIHARRQAARPVHVERLVVHVRAELRTGEPSVASGFSRGPRRAFCARWGGSRGPRRALCARWGGSRGPRRALCARWGGSRGPRRALCARWGGSRGCPGARCVRAGVEAGPGRFRAPFHSADNLLPPGPILFAAHELVGLGGVRELHLLGVPEQALVRHAQRDVGERDGLGERRDLFEAAL